MNVQNRLYRFGSVIAIAAMLLAAAPASSLSSVENATPSSPTISEIRIDQPSTDNDEYFELAGEPGASLDGLTYLVIGDGTGGSGVIEAVIDLSGQSIPSSGFFVAAEDTFTLGTADLTTSLNFENSDNVTHLLVRGFSGSDGEDLDTDDDGTLDITPWTELVDSIALVEEANPPTDTEYYYGTTSVGPDGSNVPGHAFVCDAAWQIGAFDPVGGDDTPGAPNACGTGPEPTSTPPPAIPDVLLSEIRIDQPSTDTDEYFELAGAPGTSLDGLTYLVIGDGSGGSGVVENVTDLTGYSIPSSGYFLAAEGSFTLGSADLTTNLNFENSDNVTHLLVFGFTGSNGEDLDTNDDGVLDSNPWEGVVDSVALVESVGSGDLVYSSTTVGPDGSFVPGQVYRCGTDWRIGPFDPAGGRDTPGAENDCSTGPAFGVCGGPTTAIHAIQGDGLSSPMSGDAVVIEGVVVGDFQGGYPYLGGFNLQEEDDQIDGNPATSEGIFVYQGSSGTDVGAGDVVRVRGTVSEHYGLTEVTDLTGLLDCGIGGSATAAELSLPVGSVNDFEAFEGMLVTFPQPLVISEYFNYDRYGELVLTGSRHLTPTAEFEPGSPQEAGAVQAYSLDKITLDDGRTNQNPDPAIHPDGSEFSLSNRFRGGDTVSNVTGVMSYDFDIYRIQPTQGADYTPANPRPASPQSVGGDIKVASFNVLNYFTTLDTGGNQCGPPGYQQDCRGANTTEELTRQRAKILAALESINADVFGLIEIQNDMGASVIDLVDHLNADLGTDTYAYVDTGYIGTDAIKLAIIYKPASVMPIGNYAILDSSVDPRFVDTKNRPALAQSFMANGSGRLFTLAVNHLKSKGSSCVDIGDPDTGDGSGNCNGTRTYAAQALVDWLATDPTGVGSPNYLIMGDLNSYDKEDPIYAIKAGSDDTAGTGDDFSDLVYQYQGEDAYSYVFDGQIGYLDSALAGSNIHDGVTGTTIWHINADEPDILDYDETYKAPAQDALFEPNAYRSSDHDPVIVGLSSSGIAASSPEQIGVLLQYFADSGQITGNNTAKALLDHLDKAARFKANGQDAAYRAQLEAFINQVQGKAPKFVTQEAADALSAEALALLGG